jgi:hypothetical protein
MSHMVSPASRDAVVSLPATLSSQIDTSGLELLCLHEESTVQYDLIFSD